MDADQMPDSSVIDTEGIPEDFLGFGFFMDDLDLQKRFRTAIFNEISNLNVNLNPDCKDCVLFTSQLAFIFLDKFGVEAYSINLEKFASTFVDKYCRLLDVHVQCLTAHAYKGAKFCCLECWPHVTCVFYSFIIEFKNDFMPPLGFIKTCMLAFMIFVKHWDNCVKGCLPEHVATFVPKFWKPKIVLDNVAW